MKTDLKHRSIVPGSRVALVLAAVTATMLGCADNKTKTVVREETPEGVTKTKTVTKSTIPPDKAPATRQIIVTTQNPPTAPPVVTEVTPATPGTQYVWVPGAYDYSGDRWVWVPGRYVVPDRPAAVWVPGEWQRVSNGWMWVPGHWS